MRSYGQLGSELDGQGYFGLPRGVDISRAEGEWHVAFVTDPMNDRVVVLALGTSCRCVRWLGQLDGTESGTRLSRPADVAWDPATTWTMSDDRVFIADTYNSRIVVYQVELYPVAGTMTPHYLGSFGSEGTGPGQFSHPQGITVHSYGPMFTDIHIADTGNHRISLWYYDGTPAFPNPIAQSAPTSSAEFIGISHDHYGDVIVADSAGKRLVKFSRDYVSVLKSYGGGGTWANGSFDAPTDADVVYEYTQGANGAIVETGLPYIQTAERWTATTGGQMHLLGVDVEQLAVTSNDAARTATLTFLLTGQGTYSVIIKNAGGGTVRSVASNVVAMGGPQGVYWDGKDNYGATVPGGTYTAQVTYESGYDYDNGTPRTASVSFPLALPFTVSANAPVSVNVAGTYQLTGSASSSASNWEWDRSLDGTSWSVWASTQNSSFTVYSGANYTLHWRLTAKRVSDGVVATDYEETIVCTKTLGCIQPVSVPTPVVPGDSVSAAAAKAAAGTAITARHGGQVGAGVWIGTTEGDAPNALRMFSLAGNHDIGDTTALNPFATASDKVVQAGQHGSLKAAVTFARQDERGGATERYRVQVAAIPGLAAPAYLGLAINPDLGRDAADDSLGVDPTGLIWVADPDSGAIGYVIQGVAGGRQAVVRQFSTREESWYPDPVSSTPSLAELSAREGRLTGGRDDVRFLVSLGSMDLRRGLVFSVTVVRARSLAAIRALAARVLASPGSYLSDSERAALRSFRFGQARPRQMQPSVVVTTVSPDELPGVAPASTVNTAELRAAVQSLGIKAVMFAVPEGQAAMHVRVRIYSPQGRLVRTLVDDTYDTGAYRADWDGLDASGARAAPGVYLAIMEAPGFRGTTKLVVVP